MAGDTPTPDKTLEDCVEAAREFITAWEVDDDCFVEWRSLFNACQRHRNAMNQAER